jgi:pimeloyl-ACP methyl ester carboxylesterase
VRFGGKRSLETFGVDGCTLEFRVRGEGTPVVFVHGSVFVDPWEPMLRHGGLLDDYRIVTYRRRGYGGNSAPRPNDAIQLGRTIRDQAADLVALLDHLGIERAEVVGHSLAADIVLQAVIDAPERFHTMTLLEPGMFTVPAAAGMDEAMKALAQIFEAGDYEQAMLMFLAGPRGKDVMASLAELLSEGAEEMALADTPALFDLDLPAGSQWVLDEDAARSLHHPTLLVSAADTSSIYRQSSEAIAALLPNVELLHVADAGHFVHVEQGERVAESLVEFLGRHSLGH